MKMREICQRTGLTDRTVRYWTEQGLLNPFREEQNGRLYFRFTEEDVLARHIVSKRGKLNLLVSRGMANPVNRKRSK